MSFHFILIFFSRLERKSELILHAFSVETLLALTSKQKWTSRRPTGVSVSSLTITSDCWTPSDGHKMTPQPLTSFHWIFFLTRKR